MSHEISTSAFKLFEALDKRLDRIETLMGQLVDEKEDREKAVALAAEVNKHLADLKAAIPAGTSQP